MTFRKLSPVKPTLQSWMEGASHSSPPVPLWGESERDQPPGPLKPHVSTTTPLQLQPTAGPSHWNPPRALILASPPLPLRWLRQPPSSGLRVISLPAGVALCRGVVLHRPAGPHVSPPHPPAPPPPPPQAPDSGRLWRGQATPLLLSPLVVAPPEGAGGGAQSRPSHPPPARPPHAGDYSRGVYHNFRKWQQYKGLARAHLAQSPDTEALACFFIPVLRSLSQFRPQLGTEEGVPLAVQEWCRLSNFDRMIYYEMAEKFMEFEMEENAPQSPADPVPLQAGVSPGVQLVSGTKAKPGKQVVEDPGGRKAGGKGGPQRSHKQPKTPDCGTGGHHQPIPLEAVEQYIEIMEALGLPQPDTEAHLPEPPGEQCEEEVEILRYIEKLCSKDSFISKTETIIHPHFLSDLLSPHGSLDFPQLLRDLESEAEDSKTPTVGAVTARPPVSPTLRCPSPPPARQPEATQSLPALLLSPVGQDCPYSSHLQCLALQSAHGQSMSSSVNAQALAQPPPLTLLPPESFQRVCQTPPLSPGVTQPGSHGPIVSRDSRTRPPGLTDGGRPASGQQDGQAEDLAKGEAPSLGQAQTGAPAGGNAQTRCPVESQGKIRASTGEAPVRAQASSQAQDRDLSKSQKQIKALAMAHTHSKAPTEPQAQIKGSSEAWTQMRSSTGPETQNWCPSEAQGKIGGLIGDEAQIKAPALAQSQIKAKPEAQAQIISSTEAQTQIKSLTVAQAHSEAQAEGKAPTPSQGAENISHSDLLPQDPMSVRDGCGEGEVAVKLQDRACWRIPQDEARGLGLGLLSNGQVLSCAKAPEEAGKGRDSPVPRTRVRVEKKKHDGVAVRRSKRMKRD
ncbi:NUT family member 2G-like [Mobula hypostoma]|uniref:NUT family member 2G-like n=1 Tax=Mobula hypostoma TaxID=723540 RepID=UPI002FC3732C